VEQLRDPRHLHHTHHHQHQHNHHRKHDSLGRASSSASASSQRGSEDNRSLGLSPQAQTQPIPINRGAQAGLAAAEIHPSNSLPSNLSEVSSPRPNSSVDGAVRSNSELGYYSDIKDPRSLLSSGMGEGGGGHSAAASHRASASPSFPEHQPRDTAPSPSPLSHGHRDRSGSADKRMATGAAGANSKTGQGQGVVGTPPSKISGPMNAVPITAAAGFKTRQQKTKSSFWGFAVRNGAFLFCPLRW
jgi:hypothetical protein